jgi:hypothetical protein
MPVKLYMQSQIKIVLKGFWGLKKTLM